MISNQEKLKHLDWAIESRYANQKCSQRLLSLFVKHEEKWKTKKFSKAAQDLTGAAFSLWRAAFLAEKTGSRAQVFLHGREFLQRVIDENAISFANDKNSREWTFNYYTRNARSALQILHDYWPIEVPEYVGKKRNAAARWEYCQELLDQAVAGFEQRLQADKSRQDLMANAKAIRVERKRKRAIVRTMMKKPTKP